MRKVSIVMALLCLVHGIGNAGVSVPDREEAVDDYVKKIVHYAQRMQEKRVQGYA